MMWRNDWILMKLACLLKLISLSWPQSMNQRITDYDLPSLTQRCRATLTLEFEKLNNNDKVPAYLLYPQGAFKNVVTTLYPSSIKTKHWCLCIILQQCPMQPFSSHNSWSRLQFKYNELNEHHHCLIFMKYTMNSINMMLNIFKFQSYSYTGKVHYGSVL